MTTLIGNLGSRHRASIDRAGSVEVPGRWRIEWWIESGDRWHLPAQEAAVRQWRVSGAPVVETAMRIPGGGDVLALAYAARGAGGGEPSEVVVLEVRNASPLPVALALALRPVPGSSSGAAELDEAGVLSLGGEPALLFPSRPARVVAGLPGERADPLAVAVTPLPHRSSLRVAAPLGPASGEARIPGSLPDAAAVARGWEAHADRGVRLELPDTQLGRVVQQARCTILLAPIPGGLYGGEHLGRWTGAVPILGALDRFGFAAEAAEVLLELARVVDRDGYLGGDTGCRDANGAALLALDEHVRLTGDSAIARALVEVVAAAAQWIGRQAAHRRAAGLSGSERTWGARGLEAAARLLEAAGEPRAARDALADLDRLRRQASGLAGHHDAGRLAEERDVEDPVPRSGTSVEACRAPEVASPADLGSVAVFLNDVRDRLLRERDGGIELMAGWDRRWAGHPLEVHGAPTYHGTLSFALRWHGKRPALLWQLERRPGAAASAASARITVPALSPGWETCEPHGEALLP